MRLHELEGEVETLQRENRRLAFELEAARKVVDVFHDKTDVQDLAEHNLALREQVTSLKSLVKSLQEQQRDHAVRTETVWGDGRRLRHHNSSPLLTQSESRVGAAVMPATPQEELIFRNEVQELMSKLATKESQIQMLYQRCASWEQQVIELKFELEAIKHEAKEQDEMVKAAQIQVVRCEGCSQCKARIASEMLSSLKAEKALLASAIGSKAPRTDVEHYKALAHLRGVYWLQSCEEVTTLTEQLRQARREISENMRRITMMEKDHRSRADAVKELQENVTRTTSRCSDLAEELAHFKREATQAKEVSQQLRTQLDELSQQYQIDKRRCARIILDLRGELNKQLMDIEQLHNASLLFSPKNSRGIDLNRKSFSRHHHQPNHMNAAA
ncbi:hypothetical protein PINS_up001779 [Pythium insidiosum]|nr:hypothetical protein PINS_up001779 [Pythium insidiosum]